MRKTEVVVGVNKRVGVMLPEEYGAGQLLTFCTPYLYGRK